MSSLNYTGSTYLPPNQESVALMLASGSTIQNASTVQNVSTACIKKWMKHASFVERIAELRHEITERALNILTNGMVCAANTLTHLCQNGKREAIRLHAAAKLIELRTKVFESTELARQIAEIKQQLENQRTGQIPITAHVIPHEPLGGMLNEHQERVEADTENDPTAV